MNPRRSFVRKIIYLALMVALMVPMHFIGQPAARRGGAVAASQGMLARLRDAEGLSQANLGEIDPASETIKLATLGMDNVAVSILWSKAAHYQVTKDWDKLRVTLDQIKNLQPNFVSVWKYQGWNLSYNVSVEFDDFRDRFHWVKEGILYIREGTTYNQKDHKLLSDIAWFTSNKVGNSDERRPFRRLFRKDTDFHKQVPYRETDCWLAGREWYLRSEDLVAREGLSLKGTGPEVFYVNAPMCRINYARDLEIDGSPDGTGVFGEVAQRAWSDALQEWLTYGQRDMATSDGKLIRLEDFDRLEAESKRTQEEIKSLAPGLEEKLRDQKRSQLSDEEIALLNESQPIDPKNMQPGDQQKGMKLFQVQNKLQVTLKEIAQAITGESRQQAQELLSQNNDLTERLAKIQQKRTTINYAHWKTRCEYEMTSEMILARDLIARAEYADRIETNLPRAKELYAQAFEQWDMVLKKFPSVRDDDLEIGPLVPSLDRYQIILKDTGDKLPEDFPLNDIIERAEKNPSLRN